MDLWIYHFTSLRLYGFTHLWGWEGVQPLVIIITQYLGRKSLMTLANFLITLH